MWKFGSFTIVMAWLDPAGHAVKRRLASPGFAGFVAPAASDNVRPCRVDGRVKPGHDDGGVVDALLA